MTDACATREELFVLASRHDACLSIVRHKVQEGVTINSKRVYVTVQSHVLPALRAQGTSRQSRYSIWQSLEAWYYPVHCNFA